VDLKEPGAFRMRHGRGSCQFATESLPILTSHECFPSYLSQPVKYTRYTSSKRK